MFKCWQRFLTFSFLTISLLGCTPSVGTPTAPVEQPAGTTIAAVGNGQSTVGTPSASPAASATSIPTSTATPTLPPDAVVVNTLAQEVYPFKQEGNCSLGEAIQTVLIQQTVDGCTLPASSTTVYLPTGTYTLTEADNAPAVLFGNKPMKDRLGLQPAGFPLITNKLTILGNGATIQRSGSTKFGIFQVFVGGDLTLKDLTITGGDTTDYEFGGGGALDVSAGTVMLDHVTLTGNQGQTSGAISNGGTGSGLTLINSLVTKNNSLDDGGGITNNGLLTIKDSEISYNVSKNDGGGIYNRSNQVTLDHSQLLGNLALEGGGLYNDNGVVKIINQSLVSGNVASEKDSSIPHGGGGINNIGSSAQVTIENSFIIGNQGPATTGGGIYNQATVNISGSVFAYNVSGAGGALFNDQEGKGSITGSCILENQVIGVTPEGFGNGIENDNDTPFDATQNWWDTATGPGNSVTNGVNAAPYLSAAPEICAGSIPTAVPTPAAP